MNTKANNKLSFVADPRGSAIKEVGHYDPNAVIGLYDQTRAASCKLVLDAIRAEEIDWMIAEGIVKPVRSPQKKTDAESQRQTRSRGRIKDKKTEKRSGSAPLFLCVWMLT